MSQSTLTTDREQSISAPRAVYLLYLGGILIAPLVFFGLILAFMRIGDASGWLHGHYRYQIRTVFIGLLYGLLSLPVAGLLIMIGLPLLFAPIALALSAWPIVRSVKGLLVLNRREPLQDPATWLI